MLYNCIFTGGSTRGLSYVGVFKAFEERGINLNITAGSSIGSLMMVFYMLGYNAEEMESIVNDLNLEQLFTDFNFNILSDLAFSRGEKYLCWLREKIESKYYGADYQKGKMRPVCFKDIEKEIYITAVDIEKSEVVVFSKYTYPDMELAKALRISSSMPGLLPPYKFDQKVLIDGDIARGCPIWKSVPALIDSNEKLLEFRITGGNTNRLSRNPIKTANAIVNVAAYIIDNEASTLKHDKIDVIKIDVGGILFTDFRLSKEQKECIYKIGYDTANKYFNDKNI